MGVESRQNAVAIIPNSKLAASTITNLSLPEARLGFSVELRASWEDSLDKVKATTLEVAREVMRSRAGRSTRFRTTRIVRLVGRSRAQFGGLVVRVRPANRGQSET